MANTLCDYYASATHWKGPIGDATGGPYRKPLLGAAWRLYLPGFHHADGDCYALLLEEYTDNSVSHLELAPLVGMRKPNWRYPGTWKTRDRLASTWGLEGMEKEEAIALTSVVAKLIVEGKLGVATLGERPPIEIFKSAVSTIFATHLQDSPRP